ncbi:hypothetical protein EMMF5_004468 [Cystobasidiomycetes sp. EMM_F5]
MSASRPSFVKTLLDRPLPELRPPKLSESNNPPWSKEVRAAIADGAYHPLLESALHLMNDDLFSAHFLLRKMQEDEWGKWLHACLHLAEGDLEKNAKLWYDQIEPSVLSHFWGKQDPVKHAQDAMRKCQQVMYHQKPGDKDGSLLHECRETRWKELVAIFQYLEQKHGWDRVEGTTAYTRDEDPGHKSNVLGLKYLAVASLAVGAWTCFVLWAMSAEKASSSVVRTIAFQLRTSPTVRDAIGEGVRPKALFFSHEAWIHGKVNTLKGVVDIHFRVISDSGKQGTVYFKSIRPHPHARFETTLFQLLVDGNPTPVDLSSEDVLLTELPAAA